MSRSKPEPIPCHPPAAGVRGFTLIELVVTLAVLAVLVTIAVPSFREMINRNRLVSGANEYIAVLHVAKSEAIRRNASVTVCPTTSGSACGGDDWRRVLVLASDGTALREIQIDTRLTVRPSASISATNTIRIRPDGLARQGTTTTILSGKIEVCINTTRPVLNARHVSISGARVSVDAPLTSGSCAGQVSNT